MAGFTLSTVASKGPNAIYISRERYQGIVLFGADITLLKPLFIKSRLGDVTINAAAEDEKITLMRKNPLKATLIGPFESSFDATEFIFALTDKTSGSSGKRIGLGLDYTAATDILKQLCDWHCINAELKIGEAREIIRQGGDRGE